MFTLASSEQITELNQLRDKILADIERFQRPFIDTVTCLGTMLLFRKLLVVVGMLKAFHSQLQSTFPSIARAKFLENILSSVFVKMVGNVNNIYREAASSIGMKSPDEFVKMARDPEFRKTITEQCSAVSTIYNHYREDFQEKQMRWQKEMPMSLEGFLFHTNSVQMNALHSLVLTEMGPRCQSLPAQFSRLDGPVSTIQVSKMTTEMSQLMNVFARAYDLIETYNVSLTTRRYLYNGFFIASGIWKIAYLEIPTDFLLYYLSRYLTAKFVGRLTQNSVLGVLRFRYGVEDEALLKNQSGVLTFEAYRDHRRRLTKLHSNTRWYGAQLRYRLQQFVVIALSVTVAGFLNGLTGDAYIITLPIQLLLSLGLITLFSGMRHDRDELQRHRQQTQQIAEIENTLNRLARVVAQPHWNTIDGGYPSLARFELTITANPRYGQQSKAHIAQAILESLNDVGVEVEQCHGDAITIRPPFGTPIEALQGCCETAVTRAGNLTRYHQYAAQFEKQLQKLATKANLPGLTIYVIPLYRGHIYYELAGFNRHHRFLRERFIHFLKEHKLGDLKLSANQRSLYLGKTAIIKPLSDRHLNTLLCKLKELCKDDEKRDTTTHHSPSVQSVPRRRTRRSSQAPELKNEDSDSEPEEKTQEVDIDFGEFGRTQLPNYPMGKMHYHNFHLIFAMREQDFPNKEAYQHFLGIAMLGQVVAAKGKQGIVHTDKIILPNNRLSKARPALFKIKSLSRQFGQIRVYASRMVNSRNGEYRAYVFDRVTLKHA